MNLKSFVITTTMFFVVLPQSITTEKTIKPIVEVPFVDETYQKTFIGFEGEGIYKKAQLYGITKQNTIKQLPNFQFILPEDDTNYFVSGLYGDISGEGQKDFVLILANPNSGTRLYTWTVDQNNQFSRLTKPYKIKNNQTESYPTTSTLASIYPDKDQEIVLTFGSPDRKTIILDYIGEIKQTETIGKGFLANLAGPIILKTKDLNNDNLEDIYIINNGEKIVESVYFSPERKETNTNERKKRILDLYFHSKDKKVEKIFLLQEQKLFFDKWNKEIPIDLPNPKAILLVNNNILSLINQQGEIQHYTINNQTETIKKKNLVAPIFKNKKFKNIHYLLLNDQENILLSHDKQSEILLQPLYDNLTIEETKKTNTLKPEKTKDKTVKEKTKQTNKTPKQTTENKKDEEEKTNKKPEEKPQTIILSQDTISVNIGQEASIEIKLKESYIFLDLKTNKKPKQMQFDVKKLSFQWLPTNKEIGYHTLQYDITYNKNTGIKKEEVDGKLSIINETEKIKQTKNHIIFVNAPPSIKTTQTKHNRQAQHELQIKLNISDRNKNQKLYTTHRFLADKTAEIKENIFYWTPQNKHFGENKIEFYVYDGMLYDSTFIIVEVDTLKQEIINKDLIITTVNKEFTYTLPQNKKTQHTIIKGPQNMRVSKKGTLHWIPINTQLGLNKVIIENKEINQSYNYSMDIYVNAPPVISYRPDDIEFINYDDNFTFQFQSFDQNNNQELFWSLSKGPKNMKFNDANLEWKGNKLDYNKYTIELTDTIDQSIFNGTIYVNEIPQLINAPQKNITLGDTLNYLLDIKDSNQINPLNGKKEKHTTINLISFPKNMKIKNNLIQWIPSINDIGEHNITLEISDGMEKKEYNFNIFVNDTPQIISIDSLKIQVGDTLKHILKAKDLNKNTTLTYSISSNLKNMMLNAQTGEIIWAPTIEDLGQQEILVNVSDGLISNKKNKTIQIFVYALPKFITGPPKESYINIEYSHIISAQDGFGKNIPGEDVYVKIDSTTLNNINFNKETNRLSMVPTINQTGDQEVILELKDNYNNIIKEKFIISVLISPCETADSLHYRKTQSLEKKVNEYEKVIQIIESPTTTIDTLYSISYNKRELRKKERQEKRKKQKEKKELRKNKRNKVKTITKQDTIFTTEYDTLYKTVNDTIYNEIKTQEKIQPIKEKEEQKTEKQTEQNKKTEKKQEDPITVVRKKTIIIDKKETIIIDYKTTKEPPPYGQKTGYNKIFEEQKWGQEGIKKTQKTKMESTALVYKKNWK